MLGIVSQFCSLVSEPVLSDLAPGDVDPSPFTVFFVASRHESEPAPRAASVPHVCQHVKRGAADKDRDIPAEPARKRGTRPHVRRT